MVAPLVHSVAYEAAAAADVAVLHRPPVASLSEEDDEEECADDDRHAEVDEVRLRVGHRGHVDVHLGHTKHTSWMTSHSRYNVCIIFCQSSHAYKIH